MKRAVKQVLQEISEVNETSTEMEQQSREGDVKEAGNKTGLKEIQFVIPLQGAPR